MPREVIRVEDRLNDSDVDLLTLARMQDEERSIRDDDDFFRRTGINRISIANPSNLIEETPTTLINGVTVDKNSLSYKKYVERQNILKKKEWDELIQKANERYDNAISALDIAG